MKKPTIHTSRLTSGTVSIEEYTWRKYSREVLTAIGLYPTVIRSGNK